MIGQKKKIVIAWACVFAAVLFGCGPGTENTDTKHRDSVQNGAETVSGDSETGTDSGQDKTEINSGTEETEWIGVTKDGIMEEIFLENMDIELLEEIAGNFQSMIEKEEREEREDPSLVIREGWVRIFEKDEYKKVIELGKPAMKPLYWILYKSNNNGLYEYICAKALQEISGIGLVNEDGTMQWAAAKEYLDLFTKEILNEK